MSSGDPHDPADKTGLTVEMTPTTTLKHKSSQDNALPTISYARRKDTPYPRRSDISTPATARANPFDTDVEAMHVAHWKQKAKAARKNKHSCNCLASMSKRNRITVKILIILLIVGIAVGVGFGVSKPLGAGIWRSETQN